MNIKSLLKQRYQKCKFEVAVEEAAVAKDGVTMGESAMWQLSNYSSRAVDPQWISLESGWKSQVLWGVNERVDDFSVKYPELYISHFEWGYTVCGI